MKLFVFILLLVVSTLNLSSQKLKFFDRYNGAKRISELTRIIALDTTTYLVAHSMSGDLVPYIYIEKTTDYGDSWQNVYFKDSADCSGPFDKEYIDKFIDLGEGTIWAQYKNDMIVESTDGGETWSDEFFPFDTNFVVGHYNYTDGVLSCGVWPDTLAMSYDKGKTWTKEIIDLDIDTVRYKDGLVYPEKTFVYGDTVVVLLHKRYRYDLEVGQFDWEYDFQFMFSYDKGKTWQHSQMIKNREVSDFDYVNGSIYATTFNVEAKDTVINNIDTVTYYLQGRLYKAETIESDFESVLEFNRNQYFMECNIFEDGNGYIRSTFEVYRSNDNFETWYLVEYFDINKDTVNYPSIDVIAVPTINKAMIMHGLSFSRLESDQDGIDEMRSKVDKLTIYPNPAQPGSTLSISFEILTPSLYSFSLVDISGNEYPILSETEYLHAGAIQREITIPSDISSGSYFLAVKSDGNITAMHRVIIVK